MANLAPQKIETVPIGTLKHHPKNPRKGDVQSIADSIEHNGFYGVVVAQKSTGYVLAGNHRMMAAKAAGLDSLPVAYVDVDDATALKILLADNRTNDLATYDNKELAELLADVSNKFGLEGTGYDEDFLQGLIDEIGGLGAEEGNAEEAPEAQLDKAEELRGKWGVEFGQLWEVGRHRILCGDSFVDYGRLFAGQHIDLLMTDPPYGISVVNSSGKLGKSTSKFTPIAGDDKPFDPRPLLDYAKDHIIWDGNYYADLLPNSRCWFIWNKNHAVDRTFAGCELAWTSLDRHAKVYQSTWDGWAKEGESGSKLHPTQKPVKLQVDILNDLPEIAIVADVFLGSGSCMVACEMTGKQCYGMDLEPKYVAVTLERLSEMGLEPKLVTP